MFIFHFVAFFLCIGPVEMFTVNFISNFFFLVNFNKYIKVWCLISSKTSHSIWFGDWA